MPINKDELLETLEAAGEDAVRAKLAQGAYAGRVKLALVEEWLRDKEAQRLSAASGRSEARDEACLEETRASNAALCEANSLAKEANRVAMEANSLAVEANLIAKRANSLAIKAIFIAMAALATSIASCIHTG